VDHKNTYLGDIFIIPDGIRKYGKIYNTRPYRRFLHKEPAADAEMIRVWVSTPGLGPYRGATSFVSHWSSLGVDVDGEFYGETFPAFLPASLLKDKAEGDKIVIPTPTGEKFVLTCNQLRYRFDDVGTFQDAYRVVCTRPTNRKLSPL
jgi:hypothetical protein